MCSIYMYENKCIIPLIKDTTSSSCMLITDFKSGTYRSTFDLFPGRVIAFRTTTRILLNLSLNKPFFKFKICISNCKKKKNTCSIDK